MFKDKQSTSTYIIETKNIKPILRRFPAIPQLIILFLLLLLLLSSAVFSVFKSTDQINEPWVTVELESTHQLTTKLSTTTSKSLANMEIEAKAGFVYDLINDKILYEKQADKALPIASITKLMTTLLAYEILKDEIRISVPQTATLVDSASGLQTDEVFSSQALIQYAMIASSNDAATSLATAGANQINPNASEALFIEAMNLQAKELGLKTLNFNNATGLDVDTNQAGGYGSAKDISFLLAYIYNNYPDILAITTQETAKIYNAGGAYHIADNTNQILTQIPQLLGSKTGYTLLAGGNLTIIFNAGLNRPIIITVLGSSFNGRFADVQNLLKATQFYLLNN